MPFCNKLLAYDEVTVFWAFLFLNSPKFYVKQYFWGMKYFQSRQLSSKL